MQNKHYYLLLIAVYVFFSILFFDFHVRSDGEFFYAYIRSPIIDNDLDFFNDLRNVKWFNRSLELGIDVSTPTGLAINLHTLGNSLLNAPFFLVAHAISIAGNYPTDGFSILYTGAFNMGSVIYSFFGSAILFHVFTKYLSFKKVDSFLAVLSISIATPLLVYSFYVPSFSHAHNFFAVSLFLLIWIKYRDQNNLKYWIFMGSCAGLIMMIRLVDVVFVILPIIDLILFKRDKIKNIFKKISHIGIYIVFVILAFSPMMYVWTILYGEPIPSPLPVDQAFEQGGLDRTFMNWTNPFVLEFLFSEHRGLFLWSPIFLLAIAGYYFLYKKHKQLSIMAMIMTVIVFYIHSAPFDWEAGGAFGQRRVADISPFLAIGLVALLDRIGITSITSKIAKSLVVFPLIIWNVIFVLIWRMEGLVQQTMGVFFDTGRSVNFSDHVFPHIGNFPLYFHEQMRKGFVNSVNNGLKEYGIGLNEDYWFLILLIPTIALIFFAFYGDLRKRVKQKTT